MSIQSRQRERDRGRTFINGKLKKLGSRFGKTIPSYAYNPKRKAPSRADCRKVIGAQRKAGLI